MPGLLALLYRFCMDQHPLNVPLLCSYSCPALAYHVARFESVCSKILFGRSCARGLVAVSSLH